jgi:hypothetical protein
MKNIFNPSYEVGTSGNCCTFTMTTVDQAGNAAINTMFAHNGKAMLQLSIQMSPCIFVTVLNKLTGNVPLITY